MRTRLKIDVEDCALGFCACLLEGEDFSVLHAVVSMEAGADYLVSLGDHAAYIWVGRGESEALARQFEGAA
jgi:hypothetical protein